MLGLTLEGGGAKGSYQIGAWKAFRELGIDFDGISGTSVGALNGALMIQDDFDLAYDLWYNISPASIFDIDDRILELLAEYELNQSSLQLIFEEIKKSVRQFGMDSKPLEELVKNNLKEELIRGSKKDFGIVTVCLTDMKPMEIFKEDIPSGKISDYLIASSYLPIFKSKKLDGKKFLDGGLYNNLPVSMLYQKGYKKIVAIRLLSKGRVKRTHFDDLELIQITPQQGLGNMLDFTKERARYNISLGYYDTLKAFKGLKGKNYYIEGELSDIDAIRFFMNLSEEGIKKLADLLNLPQALPYNRLILEGIIPKLSILMGLDDKATYSDIATGLLESFATCKSIDAFQIYTYNELIEEVQQHNTISSTKKDLGLLNSSVVSEILLRIDKEKLLKEALRILLKYNKSFKL